MVSTYDPAFAKGHWEMKNERYKKALDWAFGRLEDNWEKVPEEEKTYLKNK